MLLFDHRAAATHQGLSRGGPRVFGRVCTNSVVLPGLPPEYGRDPRRETAQRGGARRVRALPAAATRGAATWARVLAAPLRACGTGGQNRRKRCPNDPRPAWHRAVEPRSHVTLLGAFALRVGDRQRVLPKEVRRLIALLALNRDGLDRPTAASLLTPHLAPKNAAGSLRTTLSRLHGTGLRMLETDRSTLRLAPHVTVDCWELEALADRVLDEAPEPVARDELADLARELLPEFDDPWLRQERAWLRSLSVHALETYGRKLAAPGGFGRGVQHAPQSA